ncbi:DNA-directed RNA polymerase subunit omega [Helicobacter suis]|uniref:DNA-directed RNA polymerase subunit omega n=2 Tax=Helicobacter suis TaxID=104628 RepID=E7G558_9HELI|nr:DNA-directed RNA polymerase subunit omega [Helicobacter suis]EFX41495.1 DNA-directed RNA polymerase subunit omega [Helicobacter suis HS5]EFX43448.1 DNA-directed RNA polymerase subunit omega [Helicobacter suis HS1]BCD46213.1 DNA-directed RNA polymerase subunit omega RpoZ [Helicobacter suis]BCD47871.1 DNA-directed RNA polymerase subunit omega RpoZ [Helicobacter suis]BCD49631.1 DNA-directed RNA polymerase subunit omega RpoZ [Helicobacter suis]
MRTEEIVAKALERVNGDRYILSNLIFSRVRQLGAGTRPLVAMDIKTHKPTDIAILEIAEGKISLDRIDERY